jgi:hypothetical protein
MHSIEVNEKRKVGKYSRDVVMVSAFVTMWEKKFFKAE